MPTKRRNIKLLVAVLGSVIGLIWGATANADSSKSAKQEKQLLIVGALADADAEMLHIIGQGFESKKSLSVNLGAVGDISSICTANLEAFPQVISCDFSLSGMPSSGDYLLSVETGKGSDKYVDFALTIGATGPQGEAGPAGAVGAAGPTGAAGPIGPAGPVGPVGPVGPAGLIGPTGATGPVGPAGPVGLAGPQGLAGAVGPAGPAGPVGPGGSIGPEGPAGPVGPAGLVGLTGATGPVGPAGPVGPQGLAGAVGPAGPAGPQGLAGVVGPAGPGGAIGPQGPAGAVGPQGPAGPEGPPGVLGHEVFRFNQITTVSSLGQFVHTATCPNNKRILSGGHGRSNLASNVMVLPMFSGPTPSTSNTSTSNTSWTVVWQNYATVTHSNLNFAIWIVCAENAGVGS